jgi:CDP-diacylglycerol--serine O-phosphatidyltransferase
MGLFVACGALRLARFNVQSSHAEKKSFVGLPIPAAADMIAATVLLYYFFGGEGAANKHLVLLLMIYALAFLMVSNVRYNSFKDLDLRARMPFYAVVAMLVLVTLVVAQPQMLFFGVILAYVASGPVGLVVTLVRRRRIRRRIAEERRVDGARSAGG